MNDKVTQIRGSNEQFLITRLAANDVAHMTEDERNAELILLRSLAYEDMSLSQLMTECRDREIL